MIEKISQDARVVRKQCEQCHHQKLLTEFHRRKNKTDGRMRICADCYMENLHETQRLQEERQQQWAKQEQERKEREAQERKERDERQAAEAREKSLQANRLCPRCKEVRTDGSLWPNGHLYFTRYCEACQDYTPHSIYTLTCPLLGMVRYVGITMQSLNKRLQGHMSSDNGNGIGWKRDWIKTLKQNGLRPLIDLVSEAPNEQQAKLEETRYIYHYIQQGFPLVNHEAMFPQLVLDLQHSFIDWQHATAEEIKQVHAALQGDSWEYRGMVCANASSFRWEMREKRRLHILQWRHRHEHVYVIDNRVSFYVQSYEELRAYKHLTTAGSLSRNFAERQAILDTITFAVCYWQTTSTVSQSMSEDLAYLFNKHVPIICTCYDDSGQTQGVVIGLQSKRYLPIIHSFSYTVDPSRSLVSM